MPEQRLKAPESRIKPHREARRQKRPRRGLPSSEPRGCDRETGSAFAACFRNQQAAVAGRTVRRAITTSVVEIMIGTYGIVEAGWLRVQERCAGRCKRGAVPRPRRLSARAVENQCWPMPRVSSSAALNDPADTLGFRSFFGVAVPQFCKIPPDVKGLSLLRSIECEWRRNPPFLQR